MGSVPTRGTSALGGQVSCCGMLRGGAGSELFHHLAGKIRCPTLGWSRSQQDHRRALFCHLASTSSPLQGRARERRERSEAMRGAVARLALDVLQPPGRWSSVELIESR